MKFNRERGVVSAMMDQWRVLLLDTKPGNVNHYIALGIEAALRDDPRVELVRYADYADALNYAIEDRCNLFVAFDGEELDRGLCQRLATCCGTSVLWLTDDPYQRRCTNIPNAALFDVVFTNDLASVPQYQGKAKHLPLAANPRFNYLRVPDQDTGHYLYDVLFVGTAWPNRVSFLRQLLGELPDVKFKVALPTVPQVSVPAISPYPSAHSWRVPNTEMCRLANRARIVLTLHRDFGPTADTSVASTPGPRLFEVALAGGAQLVNLSLGEVANYFALGSEIAGFANLDECREQIRSLLAHPSERLEMAREAQARCSREHLYKHRVGSLLDEVESRRRAVPIRASIAPSERPTRILFVSHNRLHQQPFGGVEVYVDLVGRRLTEQFDLHHYYSLGGKSQGQAVACENMRTGERQLHQFAGRLPESSLMDPERERYFADLLHDLRIDLVHFHHLMHHPWSLPLVARTLGVPVVLSCADHYASCQSFNLLTRAGRYCNIPEKAAATCDLCLHRLRGAPAGSQASRRALVGAVLDNCDLLVFLSANTRDITFSQFPMPKQRQNSWVEGYPLDDGKPLEKRHRAQEVVNVAVPGNFAAHKGADDLCEIFHAMRSDPVHFHIFGRLDPPYDTELLAWNLPNVTLHGTYEPASLGQKLRDADLGLFLSIWPETYVLTLSEAWRAGVVPIVYDIGALGERVQHRVNGLKAPVGDAAGVVHLIRELLAEPDELERLRGNIDATLYRQLGDHVRLLTAQYERLLDQYRVRDRPMSFFAERPHLRGASASNVFRREATWLPHHGSSLAPEVRSFVRRALKYWQRNGTGPTLRRSTKALLAATMKVVMKPYRSMCAG